MGISQLLIVLVIVALMFSARRLKGFDDASLRSQLQKELGRIPVYSAETTRGKEAEFIRDHLPRRFPAAIVLTAIVIFCAVVWWLTR
jgi:hypothetical protein